MTPTLSPIAGLRRAVLLDPHDDTARLVLADALDEHGGPMEAKWAALIRGQCARAYYGSPVTPHESALLRELVPWLRRGERCERCKGRGFVKASEASDKVAVACPDCHGTGWLGSLAERKVVASVYGHSPEYDWLIPATFTRGFVSRVELTTAQVQDAGFMRRLFSEWPVTEAGLMGAVPCADTKDRGWWRILGTRAHAWCLPECVWNLLGKSTPAGLSHWKQFPSAEAASAALSRAIVSLGREAAGLTQVAELHDRLS